MNILILGSGGRECALAWKISQSPLCERLFIAPGNGGTRDYGVNVPLSLHDFDAVGSFCLSECIDLVFVGPEDPLVNGIVDYFFSKPELRNIRIIGPDKHAARLEGSKSFAKRFMNKYGIPTAAYRSFSTGEQEPAKDYLRNFKPPYVIKADGLAAGKGVLICPTIEEAAQTIDAILVDRVFENASDSLVIEEFLDGKEMSVFALTDGLHYVLLPSAKDYKRIGDNNTGLNTGGMGTISPVPFADVLFMNKVTERIIQPTINGIRQEKMHYCGCVFFGLMNVGGEPYVIEYNVRFGDPETQSILPRIESDFVELLFATADKTLNDCNVIISPETVVNVVLASKGYPEQYEKGKPIHLPAATNGSMVFHAGTTYDSDVLVSSGGRVMSACGKGFSIKEAIDHAYSLAGAIQFENKYYRSDIGLDLIKYF